MTKFMSLLLVAAMILTMVACDGRQDPGTSTSGKKFKLDDSVYDFEFVDSDGITRKLSDTLVEMQ